jgi:hypothetical protein
MKAPDPTPSGAQAKTVSVKRPMPESAFSSTRECGPHETRNLPGHAVSSHEVCRGSDVADDVRPLGR